MRSLFLTIAAATVFATSMPVSAMAFDGSVQHRGIGASGIGNIHYGYSGLGGGYGSRRDRNFDGIRGYSSWRHGGWGSRQFGGGYRNDD